MPGGPPLEGPKGEKLPEPPEEEDATPEASDPGTENLPPTLRWVGMHAGRRVIPYLLVRPSIQQASLERKGDTVPP